MISSLLIPISEGGNLPPFFVVPSAGATPLSLIRLARCLGPRTVFSFVFSGLDAGREPHRSVEEVASANVAEIKSVQPAGPYFVGGHCFGGTVAFEMATQLEASSDHVALLSVLESVPPRSEMAPEGPDGAGRLDPSTVLGAEVERFAQLTFGQLGKQLSRLPPKHAKRLTDFTLNQVKMDTEYCAKHPIASPILLFRTSTHHDMIFEDWNCFTFDGFSQVIVPGDAFSMLGSPHVNTLAAELDKALAGY